MLDHRRIYSACSAVLPIAGLLLALNAGGVPVPANGLKESSAAPKPQEPAKPASAPAEKTAGEAFKNVQLLKSVPESKFMANMFFITASLGVGCDHCHVTTNSGPWPFEKDDKKEKQTAREMIKMMQAINDQNFAGKTEVTCATCHAGHAEPAPLPPVLPLGTKRPAAETPEAKDQPTADQVLDRYVEAIGGRAALDKLSTRSIKGTLLGESGRTYTLEIVEKAPNRALVTITSASGNVSRTGFDGTSAWNAEGKSVFPSEGLEGARIVRAAEFVVDADVKQRYPRRFVAGKESVGGENSWLVRAGGHGDVSEMLYFSVNSGLLLRRVALTQTTLGRYDEQTDYSDYRDVDGVKIPFTIARMEVNTRYTEKYSEVKHNVPVNDSVFQMPAGGK